MEKIGQVPELVEKNEFDWPIENIFSLPEDLCYRSPTFYLSHFMLYMVIKPNSESSDTAAGYVTLMLYRLDNDPSKVEFDCGIKSGNGEVVYLRRTKWRFSQNVNSWPRFIRRSTLYSEKFNLVPENILTITCGLNLMEKSLNSLNNDSRKRKLTADYEEMFISKRFCDASIKVKEEVFPVHKAVLAARSPVFAAMFENDMSEKKTGVVNIPELDPEAFEDFLFYVYCGELDFTECEVCDLYIIADKYDVSDLKSECVNFMHSSVSVTNVGEYYGLAKQFDEIYLMDELQSFFNENSHIIVQTYQWECLLAENSTIAQELLKNCEK